MWKYGYKIYENTDSIGPAHLELTVDIWYEAYHLFRSVGYVGTMTIYTVNKDKKRKVMVRQAAINGSTNQWDSWMLNPEDTLYIAFEGVKKKEHALLAKRIVVHVHRTNKEMQIVDDVVRFNYQSKKEPDDVFNHRWK